MSRQSRRIYANPAVWIIGLVVVALFVALAVSGAGDQRVGDQPDTTLMETAGVTVDGTGLLPLADPDPAIGAMAPTLSGSTASGEELTFAPGVPRVYGFFAHWCPHCQRELPELTRWLTNEIGADGVEVAVISTAVEPDADNYPPSAWFAQVGYAGDYMIDSPTGTAAIAFGLVAFPYWVAVDADGRVVSRMTGEIDQDQFVALTELAAVG